MHFQVKMLENVRKNIFKDKQTKKKIPLMFLDVKVITERKQFYFCTLSTNNQCPVYIFGI